MSVKQVTHHNHYVPRFYLRRWSSNGNSIWDYRVVVDNDHEKYWKTTSLKATATWDDLYTQHIDGADDDSVEDYLCNHFESPASEVLKKLDCGHALSARDLAVLADYWLIQYLRTPAFMKKSAELTEGLFDSVVKSTVESVKYQLMNKKSNVPMRRVPSKSAGSPFPQQPLEVDLDSESQEITVRISTGRNGYLASLNSLINGVTGTSVHSCNWSIARAPVGSHFYTSDNPAIVFGLSADGSVIVDGLDLGQRNVYLVLPLDMHKVLLARVGSAPLSNPYLLTGESVALINEAICKTAFRHIYSNAKDDSVRRIRPRLVDRSFVKEEMSIRKAWNEAQASLEQEHEEWLKRNVRKRGAQLRTSENEIEPED